MRRLMLYDRLGNPLGELAEADVFEAVLREEINGEHSLTITTTRVLEKGIRLLYEDGRSKWREFVVAGVDAEHASGNRAIGTYYCVWSVQQDLQGVTVSVMPGVQSSVAAATALDALLSTTDRWTRGTVTQMTTGGASMYDRSAWEALSVLVDVWGGEIDTTITIGTQSGVVGRAVDLYAAQGEQTAMRRFDFGADLMSVKRTLADDPLFCRISPRGKGEQTDAGGYGRKITIESVNSGRDWLEYAPMVDASKLPDGNGGYEYPTLIVENSDCETPADLKAWGESVLAQYCTPKVTYEIDVLQAGAEGVDVTGVSLGDAVQVVDRKFGGDGIRVQGRVRSITTDLLNERDITIVIGDAEQSISSKFASVDKSLATVSNDLTVMSTAEYIDNLLDRINTEINATGGYTYIVPGNGILTFDVAVADPLNPVEASQVVEVKGGSIRIANTKTAQGEWEWKTVFTSGHIAADLVTAANITAGMIQDSDGNSYWDLDNDLFVLTGNIANEFNSYDQLRMGQLTFIDQSGLLNGRYVEQSATGLQVGRSESTYSDAYGNLILVPNIYVTRPSSNAGFYNSGSAIMSRYTLRLMSNYDSYDRGAAGGGALWRNMILMGDTMIALMAVNQRDRTKRPGFVLTHSIGETDCYVGATPDLTDLNYSLTTITHPALQVRRYDSARDTVSGYGNDIFSYADWVHDGEFQVINTNSNPLFNVTFGASSKTQSVRIYGAFNVQGNMSATGTKSRVVATDNYNERLLYAYETPSPMFGDIGSGVLDSTGYCYVSIDDVFSETARTDISYQVFLQAYGAGALYVESKSSTYFVVRGEPGLAFDWEIKCKQRDYEQVRLENNTISEMAREEFNFDFTLSDAYSDELRFIAHMEQLFDEEIQAA